MFKRKIYEMYKNLGLPTSEVSAELSMIYDYLNIDTVKELKYGLSIEEEKSVINIVKKRTETGMPLQYIVGFGYFMGEKYCVDENTLIPRPETELLVQECKKFINKDSHVLDIGTGSGCIAIEIKKSTNATVDGVDISKKSLDVAKKNAKKQNVECNFFYSDLFSDVTKKYDVIISNPPYIPIKDINTLSFTVSKFEPHAALFTNDDFGIDFYRRIIEKAVIFLYDEGYICFEIGINQKELIFKLLTDSGFSDIRVVKDFNNIDRIVIAKYFLKKSFHNKL